MSNINRSDFEDQLDLMPLGDDIAARVHRAEQLLGLLFGAILGQDGIALAETVAQTIMGATVMEHVPSQYAAEKVLNSFRDEDNRHPEAIWDYPDINQDW